MWSSHMTKALLLLVAPGAAFACGSMGLDDPKVRAVLALAVFGPMLALIPVEIFFLRRLGGLTDRWLQAYLACLLAKGAGVLAVSMAASAKLVTGIIAAELIYSFGHLAVSLGVLAMFFGLSGRALLQCALAISTIIPGLYSLSLWTIVRLVN
jgi:hypothetical protein